MTFQIHFVIGGYSIKFNCYTAYCVSDLILMPKVDGKHGNKMKSIAILFNSLTDIKNNKNGAQ